MALKGNLKDLNVVEFFQTLYQQNKTGEFIIENPKKIFTVISFHDGKIIDVKTSDKQNSLELFLINKNIISLEDMKKIVHKSKVQLKKITTVLYEENIIPEIIKNRLTDIYFKQIIFDVLLFEEGEFEFVNKEIDIYSCDVYFVHVEQILLEHLRQKDEITLIKTEIDVENVVLTKTGNLNEKLTGNEKEIYNLFGESIDINLLLKSALLVKFDVYKTVRSLVKKNLVTISKKLLIEEERQSIDNLSYFELIRIFIFVTIFISILLVSFYKTKEKFKTIKFSKIKIENINEDFNIENINKFLNEK